LTADKWWTRTWNRWMGTVMATDSQGNPVLDKKTKLPTLEEYPRNAGERNLMREVITEVATKLNMDVSELQAVLWYTEQALYRQYGIDASSVAYDTAATKYFASKRGRAATEAANRRANAVNSPAAQSGGPVPITGTAQPSNAGSPQQNSGRAKKAPRPRTQPATGLTPETPPPVQ